MELSARSFPPPATADRDHRRSAPPSQPVKQLELRLMIINISNEVYFDQVHLEHVVPGAARTFLFAATVKF